MVQMAEFTKIDEPYYDLFVYACRVVIVIHKIVCWYAIVYFSISMVTRGTELYLPRLTVYKKD